MRAIYVFAIVLLVAFAGFAATMIFVPKWRPGPVKEVFRKARGYGPAETPEDALEKFRKAIKERDYDTASTFVGGDYSEHMSRSAESAEKLALSIDALEENLTSHNIKSDMLTQALNQLQPFPKELQVKGQLDKKGDVAYALLYEEPLKLDKPSSEKWRTDPLMFRSLQPDLTVPLVVKVEIRKDGNGYKIFFPPDWVNDRLRKSTDKLRNYFGNYVRGLDQVKYEVKKDTAPREEIESSVKKVIEDEAK